jgi:ectoine hydroxylase-related dioxygenase (phytanoyl-CoA dioxygenase family)
MTRFQKVLQRKGSLLIFTRELPHNIFQNLSGKWRFAQYLRMAPLSSMMLTEFEQQKRKECVRRFLPEGLAVDDPISREIYMME